MLNIDDVNKAYVACGIMHIYIILKLYKKDD